MKMFMYLQEISKIGLLLIKLIVNSFLKSLIWDFKFNTISCLLVKKFFKFKLKIVLFQKNYSLNNYEIAKANYYFSSGLSYKDIFKMIDR